MRTIKWLLINHILYITKWNELKNGKKNFNRIWKYILVGIAAFIFAYIWITKTLQLTKIFADSVSYVEYILFPLIVSSSLFTIGSFAIKGVGILYYGDDLKLLLSMPIKMYQIVLSKFILLEFYIIGFDIILIYPSVFFYGLLSNAEIGYYVLNFINIFFIMIIPSLIGIGLGIFVYRIFGFLESSNLKIKGILQVMALMVFVFLAIFADLYKEKIVNLLHFFQSKNQFYIDYLYHMFLSQNKTVVWSWAIFLLVGIAAFVIITISYRKTAFILSLSSQKNKTVRIERIKKHNQLVTLIIREKERYFSIPVYVLNTMLGMILCCLYIVAMIFFHNSLLSYLAIISNSFVTSGITVGIINAFIITICVALTNITSSSISIEGKRRISLKVYPIETKKFFGAKILFQLCITVPVAIVTNTIAIVIFRLNIIESIIGYVAPIVFAMFSSLIGCLINVCFPNYEWKNVAFIVKQSMAAILSVFVNLGIVAGTFYIVCRYFDNNVLQSLYGICGGVFLIDIILITIFILRAEMFYEKL